jgi:hypothetical protein
MTENPWMLRDRDRECLQRFAKLLLDIGPVQEAPDIVLEKESHLEHESVGIQGGAGGSLGSRKRRSPACGNRGDQLHRRAIEFSPPGASRPSGESKRSFEGLVTQILQDESAANW